MATRTMIVIRVLRLLRFTASFIAAYDCRRIVRAPFNLLTYRFIQIIELGFLCVNVGGQFGNERKGRRYRLMAAWLIPEMT